ncbi:MAG: RNA polymerase sigma factor [Acidobacteria bacterium]|nr:RNA polymerase sigma factor [Acidobacteriota bacterium]
MGTKATTAGEFCLSHELVNHMRQNSRLEQKVAELFELLRDPLYRYLLQAVGSAAEAEDLTQEVFLRLYSHLRKGEAVDNCRAWIFRVAHNLAIDLQRKRMHLEPLDSEAWEATFGSMLDPNPDAEKSLVEAETLKRFQVAVSRLPEQERHCLNLRAEGLTYREIAEVLGSRVSTVHNIMLRVITRIQKDAHV